jgi:hypothetical protein
MTSETLSQVRARLTARRPARGSSRRAAMAGHGSALLFLFAFAALALLVLSAPRFAAQALLLPVSGALEALQTGAPLTPEQLATTREALARARRLDPADGKLSSDLALIELLQAGGGAKDRRAQLEAAIADLERSLTEAPTNSFAWARLAGARLALDGAPSAKMLAALRMSYVTGLYVDKIMPFRASLALSHWESLDAGLADFAKRELIYLWERRGAWAQNQLPLIKLICRTGRTGLLAQALIEAHRSLKEFDKLYPTHLAPEACAKLIRP